MRMISTLFAGLFFVNLNTANAQAGEMASNNTLTGKEHLSYTMVPEINVWKEIAGLNEISQKETNETDVSNESCKECTLESAQKNNRMEIFGTPQKKPKISKR